MRRWTVGVVAAMAASLLLGLGAASYSSAQDKTEKPKERKGTLIFEIYKDAKEAFRWRLKSPNGQVIATGGQGYKAKADCEKSIENIMKNAAKAKVKEVTE